MLVPYFSNVYRTILKKTSPFQFLNLLPFHTVQGLNSGGRQDSFPAEGKKESSVQGLG